MNQKDKKTVQLEGKQCYVVCGEVVFSGVIEREDGESCLIIYEDEEEEAA